MTSAGSGGTAAQLPPIDPVTGFLPPGVHPCTWAEFEYTFVDCAPHPDHRRRRLKALEVYVDCLDDLFPDSTLWLDGGFVSHKADPPFDIDVLAKVKPGPWATVNKAAAAEMDGFNAWVAGGQQGYPPKTPTMTQLGGLSTHHAAQVGNGAFYPRIQPFGGRIDSFIIPADMAKALAQFRRDWMQDFGSGARKGFAEVKPDDR
ncbi:DUF6932 family protein [Nocardioides sp. Leaf307]|uniref:DUF6932 family protein n=1 Tax=Nocardioides sp. Leaf307 TaxID=1736331 RepID=UPI000703C09C|nr:hypothetical protein [Nocardioides sp. Leaf307]KQQ43078.1 hypothetical protein ASF50_03530 [Nocardioides sp. Leaf307]